MQRRIFFVLACLALTHCEGPPPPPDSAYYNHGQPEQLLDTSAEVVNLHVATSAQLNDFSRWVSKDKPTRAELYCNVADLNCKQARRVLESHGVPVMQVPSAEHTVALIYERVLAHDCHQTYLDDAHGYHWTNQPDWGCSIAGNMVQEVTDKREFVSPNIMDVPPATGATGAYNRAYQAQAAQSQSDYSLEKSTLSQVSATSGGGQ